MRGVTEFVRRAERRRAATRLEPAPQQPARRCRRVCRRPRRYLDHRITDSAIDGTAARFARVVELAARQRDIDDAEMPRRVARCCGAMKVLP